MPEKNQIGRWQTSFEILPSQSAEEGIALSQTFEALLTGTRDANRSGDEIDNLMATLGVAHFQDQEFIWELRPGLPPSIVSYLQSSVSALNALLRNGTLVVDVNGNIRQPQGV